MAKRKENIQETSNNNEKATIPINSQNNLSEDIFNIDENEVKHKFNNYRYSDPFPSIFPALLNSVDIHNYVLATGMISPYYYNQLKPVTYGIKLSNAEYLCFEGEQHTRREGIFGNNYTTTNGFNKRVFTLKSNSILYVSIESYLRLPLYIAARFNLKINYIHKGLLLGTGPVVDPGFEGKLCVPIHNFTNNDYELEIDSTFIWMEFTKISPNKKWSKEKDLEQKIEIDPKDYDINEKGRINRKISDYVANANGGLPIYTSVSEYKEQTSNLLEITKTENRRSLEEAKETLIETKNLNKSFLWAVVVSLVAIAISLFTVSFSIYRFNKQEISIKKETESHFQQQIDNLNTKINSLSTVIFEMKKENQSDKKKKNGSKN